MKRYLSFTFIIAVFTFLFVGCSKDDDGDQVNFDGSTNAIVEFVGSDIYDELINLGMEIHSGDNPPNIEGKYLMAPTILENSNVPTDIIGLQFNDLLLEFSNQKGLEITFTGVEAKANSVGKGSFISGSGDHFSVFLDIINKRDMDPKEMEEIYVFSGRIAPEGIYDLQLSLFMVENNGNANTIENGQGRLFIDEDGLSERRPADFQKIPQEGMNFSTQVQN